MKKTGNWNPSRVFNALGRIGYNPVSAILDIVDNSISAGANKVLVDISFERANKKNGSRIQITSFSIIDNGCGMDEDGIDNALTLGSSSDYYSPESLNVFGMGLKSASSSLGKRLTIISRKEKETIRAVLDQDTFQDGYNYDFDNAKSEEVEKLNDSVGLGNSGTIIIIDKVHSNQMPRPEEITDELKSRAGTIFLAFIEGRMFGNSKLELIIQGQLTIPIDPLFRNEIPSEADGDLDENNWDGTSVKWIERPRKIQLNDDGSITATVAVTQLPHPPSCADIGLNQSEIRDRYRISAKNYGMYIYRHGRLISWADHLDNMIVQNQDLYAFRGILEIDRNADDILNLDVTKSHLHLSDIAHQQLIQIITDAKKKSENAWTYRKNVLNQKAGNQPHQQANEELDRVAQSEAKEEEMELSTLPENERNEIKQRIKTETKQNPINEDEKIRLEQKAERVQFVNSLPNNYLWERARHPSLGEIVRVNQSHRFFSQLVYIMPKKAEIIKILDVLFFGLAKGEGKVLYSPENKSSVVDKILSEYREQVGNALSEIVRKLETDRFTDIT